MTIQEQLQKYQNQFGMIINISELLKELKQNYPSSEILEIQKQILNHNNKINATIQNQITKIEKQPEFIPRIPKPESSISQNISKSPGPKIEIDVSTYLNALRSAESQNEILEIVQNIVDTNLLNTIYYKLWEEIIFYKRILCDTNEPEDIEFCNHELTNLNNIVLVVSNYIEILKKGKSYKLHTNKVIFLNDNGENCFLEDLDKIDHSEYPAFDSLLTSIINGTFNKLRTFYTSGNPIYEIRSVNKHRILCDRLGKNVYIVLLGFKKNNDFTYENTPEKRYLLYMEQREDLKQLIDSNNQTFWEQQEQELKKVWTKLEHDVRRK